MRQRFLGFFFFISSLIYAQNPVEITGFAEGRAFGFLEDLPFWLHTNTNGFLSEESNVGVSAFAKAAYNIVRSHQLRLGLGGFGRDGFTNAAQRSDLYLEYSNSLFTVTAGAKSLEQVRQNLSTINGNILFTGNVRALPGVLLSTTKPLKFGDHLTIDAEIAHYRLNDDRIVNDVNIHYKSIEFGWEFNASNRLSAGLRHYVQWGGITDDGIALPNNFNAFARVFIGASGGGNSNSNESINALGNHLGTYEITYTLHKGKVVFDAYHHTLFDDRSGRELNNFPDGVWGLHLKPKEHPWLKGVLYEYVQTISQSGRPRATNTPFGQQSGGDNYFANTIYRSGWTYEGQTIGLPFIRVLGTPDRPISNRSIAHHIGVFADFKNWEFTSKLTYLQNLGTFGSPLEVREKQFLSYAEGVYTTKKLGQLRIYLGADFLNTRENNIAAGFGYRYVL